MKEKEKVFNDFVNDRWTEQLATFEEKIERAIDCGMDEAFDCAWDYQEKKMPKKENDLNFYITQLAMLTGEIIGMLSRPDINDYLNKKFSNDELNNVTMSLLNLGNFFLIKKDKNDF